MLNYEVYSTSINVDKPQRFLIQSVCVIRDTNSDYFPKQKYTVRNCIGKLEQINMFRKIAVVRLQEISQTA